MMEDILDACNLYLASATINTWRRPSLPRTAIMTTLAREATVKKNVNVLQHAMGYFKKRLAALQAAPLP
jgi:uncharacterized protein YbgA (DUF1722 family)